MSLRQHQPDPAFWNNYYAQSAGIKKITKGAGSMKPIKVKTNGKNISQSKRKRTRRVNKKKLGSPTGPKRDRFSQGWSLQKVKKQ